MKKFRAYCSENVSDKYQQNVNHNQFLGSDKRKWMIGQKLKFIGYMDDEHENVLKPGDIVFPLLRNKCGMGIDVKDVNGVETMVWPEEVEII